MRARGAPALAHADGTTPKAQSTACAARQVSMPLRVTLVFSGVSRRVLLCATTPVGRARCSCNGAGFSRAPDPVHGRRGRRPHYNPDHPHTHARRYARSTPRRCCPARQSAHLNGHLLNRTPPFHARVHRHSARRSPSLRSCSGRTPTRPARPPPASRIDPRQVAPAR